MLQNIFRLNQNRDLAVSISEDSASAIKRKIAIFYTIYIFFNALVVFKYGTRQHFIAAWIITLIYSIFLVVVLLVNIKLRLKENFYKYLFFIVGALFFIFSIWLNAHVDKYGLKVDRWSAMEACIKALINDIILIVLPIICKEDLPIFQR